MHDARRAEDPVVTSPSRPESPGTVPALTSSDARAWAQRVPVALLRTLVVVGVLVCVGTAVTVEETSTTTAADIEDPAYVLVSALQSVWLASVVLVLVVPLLATTLAAAGMLLIAQRPDLHAGAPGLWWAAGTVLAVLATADAVTRLRQRALGHVWARGPGAEVRRPVVPDRVRDALVRPRWSRVAGGAAALLVGAGFVALYVHDASAAAGFRRDALVTRTTVDAVNGDATEASVVVGRTRYRVPLPATYPEPGDSVEVRHDPATGRAELVDDAFDPTLAFLPAMTGLLLGLALLGTERARTRRLDDLLTRPGGALRVRGSWSERDAGVRLYAVDDGTRPFAVAPRLLAVLDDGEGRPRGPAHGVDHAGAHGDHADDGWDDHDHDPDDDGADLGPQADVTALGDDELLALARRLADAPEPDTAADADLWSGLVPVAPWDLTPMTVVGLRHDGAPVVVLDDLGVWHVSRSGVRGPRGRLRLRGPAVGPEAGRAAGPVPRDPADGSRRLGWTPDADASRPDRLVQRRKAAWERFARRTGRVLPWFAAPVLWASLHWLLAEGGVSAWRLLTVATAPAVGWSWSMLGHTCLDVRPGWLHVRGRFRDQLVAWSRVTSVAVDDAALVVRLDHDTPTAADALLFAVHPDALPIVRGGAAPPLVAERLLRARQEGYGARPPWVRSRPSTPVLVGLAWAAAIVLALVTAR